MNNPVLFHSGMELLYPMIALAWWTAIMLALVACRRLNPSLNKGVDLSEYTVGEPDAVPPYVSQANRNMVNLFEMPVLYYLVCILLHLAGGANSLTVGLAWAYVALRIIHSLIHVTYNRVWHRLAIFGLSTVVLMVLMGEMTRILFTG